jgi:SfnB family sulfur acquisition oxidoreductase
LSANPDWAAENNAPERAAPRPVRPPTEPAHVIKDDAEAIAVAEQLAPILAAGAAARDRNRTLPYEELDLFSQSGLWGIAVPRAFGGPQVSYATVGKVYAIISAADPSLGQIAQNHNSAVYFINAIGDEGQRRYFLGKILEGYRFGNASSETGRTGPVFQTRIRREGDKFVINGRKFYSTGAVFGHFVTVVALDENDKTWIGIVEAGTPGFTVLDDWESFGQRTTASGTAIVDNVVLPADHILPIHRAYESFPQEAVTHLTHVGIDVGIAAAAIDDTIAFVRTHSRPWPGSGAAKAGDDPYVIAMVGDLKIRLHAAESAMERAGRILDVAVADPTPDNNAAASVAMSEARVLATDAALLASNKLFELAGTSATLHPHAFDRHWRNARTHTVHDPIRWRLHAVGNYFLNGVKPGGFGRLKTRGAALESDKPADST